MVNGKQVAGIGFVRHFNGFLRGTMVVNPGVIGADRHNHEVDRAIASEMTGIGASRVARETDADAIPF